MFLFVIVSFGALLMLKWAPMPFLWTGLLYSLYFLFVAYRRTSWGRVVAWNIAACLICVTGVEAYFAIQSRKPVASTDGQAAAVPAVITSRMSGTMTQTNAYFIDDFLLGYAARKGVAVTSKHEYGGQLIYDTTYTIGRNGLRLSPHRAAANAPGLLFFGDSFTFGEGLHDNEVYPYRVEEESAGKFKTFNFAFHGYGPHQMLARLESPDLRTILGAAEPAAAFYLTNEDQPRRGAGRASWDVMGPRYELQDAKLVKKPGHAINYLKAKIVRKLNASFLWTRLSRASNRVTAPEESARDFDLFIAMLQESQRLLEEHYHAPLIVILFWKGDHPETVYSRLMTAGIYTVDIHRIIPDVTKNSTKYSIAHDGHPNALAHRMLAEYLVGHMDDLIGEGKKSRLALPQRPPTSQKG
jgi:hypothetical protein